MASLRCRWIIGMHGSYAFGYESELSWCPEKPNDFGKASTPGKPWNKLTLTGTCLWWHQSYFPFFPSVALACRGSWRPILWVSTRMTTRGISFRPAGVRPGDGGRLYCIGFRTWKYRLQDGGHLDRFTSCTSNDNKRTAAEFWVFTFDRFFGGEGMGSHKKMPLQNRSYAYFPIL